MRLGAVILAAGFSTRMGQPKMLLPWGAGTVLSHIVQLWQALEAAQIAVVCAPPPHPIHPELDALEKLHPFPSAERILNPTPERGMFSSLRCAALWPAWHPELTDFAIVLGDQPQIALPTLRLLQEHACLHRGSISQPSFRGRSKHPLILPRADFAAIATTAHVHLRDYLAATKTPRALLELADDSLAFDLDTPADYALVQSRFARETPA